MANPKLSAHHWKPGQSGNPGGKPKRKRIFPFTKKDLDNCFFKWKDLVENGKLSDAVRLRAAKDLVEYMSDRMWGKPHQSLDVTADKPLAAIVNITLGSSTLGDVQAALPASSKLCLGDENSGSREVDAQVVEVKEETPSLRETNDVLPDWLERGK